MNLVQFPGLGLSFEIDRVAFTIGGVSIYWYGVCIAVGLCLALVFAFRHSIEFGVDPDGMVDVILIGVVLGIVSARAYYVAMAPFKYQSIWEMIAIRDGGLAIYGGIIGGFLFGGLACKWRKVPVLPMFDLTAMGFLLGQGCGRWGNFFNQEAFGCNTTLPWGMYSEGTRSYLMGSTVTVQNGVTIDPNLPVHPTFLYESIWCLVGFILLFRYMSKGLRMKKTVNKEAADAPVPLKGKLPANTVAAISAAIYRYMEDSMAEENTIITIDRAAKIYSPWSSKIYATHARIFNSRR